MPASQQISLGIGHPSSIGWFLTLGLGYWVDLTLEPDRIFVVQRETRTLQVKDDRIFVVPTNNRVVIVEDEL